MGESLSPPIDDNNREQAIGVEVTEVAVEAGQPETAGRPPIDTMAHYVAALREASPEVAEEIRRRQRSVASKRVGSWPSRP